MTERVTLARPGRALALVGAQYGSEGKGVVAHSLASLFDFHVRTGGPNAGHTIVHEGRTWKMRQVPCGWVNPKATLVIGPGAVIDWDLLCSEVKSLEDAGYSIRDRLFIDVYAGIITKAQHTTEGGTEGHAHKAIGSTGEGVGLARMARINRGALIPIDRAPYRFARVWDKADDLATDKGDFLGGSIMGRTSRLLREGLKRGWSVFLEGTQGCGLSLTHGEWPYVTSHDTNAATLAADAGVPPNRVDTILVARTYPIRVAGNSGPLKDELSFEDLGVEPETTTVTGKVRRIGEWDPDLIADAVALNDPIGMVLTFLDYVWPEVAGLDEWENIEKAIGPGTLNEFLDEVSDESGVQVIGVGTGGPEPRIAWRS